MHYNSMSNMEKYAPQIGIKAIMVCKHPPRALLAISQNTLIGYKDKCIAAGMYAYLPKPIVETHLKIQILKYLNAKKLAA